MAAPAPASSHDSTTDPSWCALLRGIGPGNPNMRNEKLRAVFTDLGFDDVASVISSGNIIFSADSGEVPHDGGALGSPERADAEAHIQAALQEALGIDGGTVLRSRAELESLVQAAPFGEREHSRATYLLATFLKDPAAVQDTVDLPTPPSSTTELLGHHGPSAAVLSVTDTTAAKTPDVMVWLERAFGKQITTRTWRTVTRILAKMP
ncbi:DUF1697 domain-containing protein [Nesterenkonia xinjiangensis]|uniref:Uncharacterized protein (DUF1697 family) n=1 Tax=Nesterenkonia xinjiangensis TaxID=225327 RepID=A0A7Z0GMJ2_9MICC|nr:DUF1697 domain-containing protein [Nesterenkonia xinjiangensis]NYJ78655.1 uncharacterized protein (DUF1697 family) [Nesterenkonia xinjiangensis]